MYFGLLILIPGEAFKINDFAARYGTYYTSATPFFEKCGYDAEIDIVDGQMPCAIAVITKKLR